VAASGQEDDDPLRESRAYNQSIYLFVATPYVLLGAFGLLVYRGMRKAPAAAAPPHAAAGGPLHVDTAEPPAVREPGPDGGGPDGAG
jgi:hypothetical protein